MFNQPYRLFHPTMVDAGLSSAPATIPTENPPKIDKPKRNRRRKQIETGAPSAADVCARLSALGSSISVARTMAKTPENSPLSAAAKDWVSAFRNELCSFLPKSYTSAEYGSGKGKYDGFLFQCDIGQSEPQGFKASAIAERYLNGSKSVTIRSIHVNKASAAIAIQSRSVKARKTV